MIPTTNNRPIGLIVEQKCLEVLFFYGLAIATIDMSAVHGRIRVNSFTQKFCFRNRCTSVVHRHLKITISSHH